MSTNHTQHHRLCQWLPEDAVIRTDFNEDNTKLDAALHGLQTSKAEQTALSALQSTVAGKAEQSALSALQSTVAGKAEQSALAALQVTVNNKANNSTVSALTARVGNVEVKQAADVATLRGENCWIPLARVRLTADSATFSVPLAGIPLHTLRQLMVSLRFNHSSNVEISLRYNGNASKTYESHYFTPYSESGKFADNMYFLRGGGLCSGDLTILPMMSTGTAYHYLGTATVGGSTMHYTCGRNTSIPFLTLTSLDFFTTSLLLAGSEVAIYGLKEIP